MNQPVRGDYRIAVLSLKGGVGKTTTTVGLGATFASVRGDRVIAVDANPDLGTLVHRAPRQTRSTVRTLLDDPDIRRYSDVRAHTSQAPSRLEVLASEQDPAVSEAFSESDYRDAMDILRSYYNIILTDCGTGLLHSAMAGVLDLADTLVLVTSPAIDGARSASATLDWLEHHGHGDLAARTVVVVNASRPGVRRRSTSTSCAACSPSGPGRSPSSPSTSTSPRAPKSTSTCSPSPPASRCSTSLRWSRTVPEGLIRPRLRGRLRPRS